MNSLICQNRIFPYTLLFLIFISIINLKLCAQSNLNDTYIGVSYYPKIAGEQIDSDIKRMKEIGITQVRFGEFNWISMEPKEGKYDLGWLEKAVNKFTDAGIAVELCTPTGAPPVWLEKKHPEILPVNNLGLVVGHGGRRQYCPNSEVYKEYCKKIVEKLGQKFGRHKGIIAWQIDNELWGDCFCKNTLQDFHKWLKIRYGTIENLNNLWCNVLWSQKYQSFEQIPLPNPNTVAAGHHPSLILAYRRFMSESYVNFCNEQVKTLRKFTSVPITTNGHNPLYQEIDYAGLFNNLDIVCTDSYAPVSKLYRYGFEADWIRGLGKPFWLAETAVSSTGGTSVSSDGVFAQAKGALRAKMWLNYALGAKLVSFWLWQQHWAGQELECGSLIYPWGDECANTPEIKEVAEELNHYKEWIQTTRPKPANAAFFYELPMQWIFEATPISEGFQYDAAISSYYKVLSDAGVNKDIIMGDVKLKGYDIVFSPYMPAFEPDQLKKIENFVENGGTWVLGPLSACRTLEATAHRDACYGSELENWLGIHVRHRLPPLNVTRLLADRDTVECSYWCDAYELQNENKIIARYIGGALDGMPAIVESKIGKGRVIIMGTKPDDGWLVKYVKKIMNGKTCNADPGVFITERVDENNNPAGIIVVNTNQWKSKYIYNGETRILNGYGVDILPSHTK